MKRLNSPGSLVCTPKDEEYVESEGGGYSKEFQAMLESLEREDCGELEIGMGKKRRLSSVQVSALERCFAAENKLEPERKARLADELGLQPRQVAIWFQNRRARWKTKRLEKDYGVLKAEFGSLKLCFDELRIQNEALAQKVREMKAKVCGGESDRESTESAKEESPANNGGERDGLDHRRVDEEDDDNDMHIITTEQRNIEPYGHPNSDREKDGNLKFSLALNGPSSSSYSSSSSSSSLMANWFQVSSESSRALLANNPSALFGSDESNCNNFFSVDQAPTLYGYFPEP